jgi:FtsZ-interacting cell division protein ZipA
MGWVVLAVLVVLIGLLVRATNKRARGSSVKDGPISRNSSANYDNVQNQASSQEFRGNGGI